MIKNTNEKQNFFRKKISEQITDRPVSVCATSDKAGSDKNEYYMWILEKKWKNAPHIVDEAANGERRDQLQIEPYWKPVVGFLRAKEMHNLRFVQLGCELSAAITRN